MVSARRGAPRLVPDHDAVLSSGETALGPMIEQQECARDDDLVPAVTNGMTIVGRTDDIGRKTHMRMR